MRKVSCVAILALAGCQGGPPIIEAKARLGEAQLLLSELMLRLDQIDIDKDGYLSVPEATIAISTAWLEWEARQRRSATPPEPGR